MSAHSRSRREFPQLGAAATVTLAATLAFAFERRPLAASDRVGLACIGIGECNFADGATTSLWGESGFRFNGPDGVMQVSPDSLRVTRRPTGPADAIRRQADEVYLLPEDYDDRLEHFRNFFAAVRGEAPVVEDPVVGLRAAGPALMTNRSQWEDRIVGWDPVTMIERSR